MPFNTFANRAEPDQAALVNMIRYYPTLVDLTSNFFNVLFPNMKVYIIIHSRWSLA